MLNFYRETIPLLSLIWSKRQRNADKLHPDLLRRTILLRGMTSDRRVKQMTGFLLWNALLITLLHPKQGVALSEVVAEFVAPRYAVFNEPPKECDMGF